MSGVMQVAIKFIERSEVSRHQKHVRREVVNHSSLLHPHVRACLPAPVAHTSVAILLPQSLPAVTLHNGFKAAH